MQITQTIKYNICKQIGTVHSLSSLNNLHTNKNMINDDILLSLF